jgi:hypothetical protein
MTTDVLERALRAFARRTPFRLFFIEFTSGDRVPVAHPEAVGRRGELFLYRGRDHGQRVFHSTSVCQLIDPAPKQAKG